MGADHQFISSTLPHTNELFNIFILIHTAFPPHP